MSWQDAFTNYTTGTAFNLTLSHDQASLLAWIGDSKPFHKWQSKTGRSTFVPCFRGLERRGLAEHNQLGELVGANDPRVKLKWIYRLTPAGERVHELLKLCGVAATDSLPIQPERVAS